MPYIEYLGIENNRITCTNSKLTTYLKEGGFHKITATVTTTCKEGIYLGVSLGPSNISRKHTGFIISLPNITSIVSPMSHPRKKKHHIAL